MTTTKERLQQLAGISPNPDSDKKTISEGRQMFGMATPGVMNNPFDRGAGTTKEQFEPEEELGFDIEERMAEPDIPIKGIMDGITVVNWGDILSIVMPNYWDDFKKHLDSKGEHGYPSYTDRTDAVNKWADEHDGIVWSWDGESWLDATETDKAIEEAKKQGKKLVVMEYLS